MLSTTLAASGKICLAYPYIAPATELTTRSYLSTLPNMLLAPQNPCLQFRQYLYSARLPSSHKVHSSQGDHAGFAVFFFFFLTTCRPASHQLLILWQVCRSSIQPHSWRSTAGILAPASLHSAGCTHASKDSKRLLPELARAGQLLLQCRWQQVAQQPAVQPSSSLSSSGRSLLVRRCLQRCQGSGAVLAWHCFPALYSSVSITESSQVPDFTDSQHDHTLWAIELLQQRLSGSLCHLLNLGLLLLLLLRLGLWLCVACGDGLCSCCVWLCLGLDLLYEPLLLLQASRPSGSDTMVYSIRTHVSSQLCMGMQSTVCMQNLLEL